MDVVFEYWKWAAAVLAVIVFIVMFRRILWLCGVIIVPDDSIGVVTKKFVLFGKHQRLPDGSIIALNGEAGYQADTLAPGLHLALWPQIEALPRLKELYETIEQPLVPVLYRMERTGVLVDRELLRIAPQLNAAAPARR